MRTTRSAVTRSSIALLAATSLVLTACGREEGGGTEAQSEEISAGEATGEIDVWAMGAEGDALQDFSAAFEEANPDATVNVTAVPWESAHDKLAGAIASGETPDVSLVGTTWMGEFAEAGGLMPTPENLVDEAAFFEGPWQSTEVGGTSYGVPWYVETRVLFYRTDLAEKAGWDEAPQTWDDLKTFTQELQEQGGADFGTYLQPGQTGSWQTMLPFAWSNGASLTNEEGTEYTIDSPETAEALDYYASYFEDGLTEDRLLDPGEIETGFAEGKYGSFISGPWHTALVEDAGLAPDKFAVAPLPGPDGTPAASFAGGGNLAVFNDSDNADNAWKYVQWLTEPETQQGFYEEVGSLPSVQAAWETGELATDERLQVFGTQLETAVAPPAVPTWEQVAGSIDAATEQAVKGGTPPEEATAEMQSQAESIGTGL